MKQNYQLNKPHRYYSVWSREWIEFSSSHIYEHKFVSNCRYPRTYNERWQNERDLPFVRAKRRKLPSSWDDLRPSYNWGSSWKRFTKKRKQYL